MDQCRSRLKLSENFERHWSIRISGEIHINQSLVHTFSWGNSYGPMVLKVLLKFPPTLVLVHGWLFPVPSVRGRKKYKLFQHKLFQKRPDVHKTVLSVKLRSPRPKSVNFEDFLLICTVFSAFWALLGGWGGVKPNFADKNFMDTQTFLIFGPTQKIVKPPKKSLCASSPGK